MRPAPPLPSVSEASDRLEDGHLWLQEYVTGPVLAFSMDDSGLLTFAVDGDPLDEVPPSLTRAVAHVRESLDRDALRSGVDDVEQFVFYGIASRYEGVEYDWDALSPFLGLAIWADSEQRYVTPDVTDRVFDAVGLSALPTFERELPATQFHPDRFEMPTSHWSDERAAGIVVRKKGAGSALLERSERRCTDADGVDPDTAIESAVTCGLPAELATVDATVETIDLDALSDRLFDRVARVAYWDVRDELARDPEAVRSTVGAATRTAVRTMRKSAKQPE